MVEGLDMLWLLISVIPYFLIFITLYAGQYMTGRRQKHLPKGADNKLHQEQLKLSVIIPIRNESVNIPRIAADLKNQDYPGHLTEIILIDDNSSDYSYNIALEAFETMADCHVIGNRGAGKKEAISTGIDLSSGSYIITTDADCHLPPGWLTSINDTIIINHPDIIIGPVYPLKGRGIHDRFMQLEFLSVQSVTEASAKINRPVMAGGANLVFSKLVAEGYRDYIIPGVKSGDDMFLLHHAKKEKKKIVFNNMEEGAVFTPMPGTIRKFVNQRLRWSGKSLKYKDSDTIILGVITAFTSLFITSLLVTSLFIDGLIPVILSIYLVKSIPDLLLLYGITGKISRRELLVWFIPLQAIYPVYVTLTVITSLVYKPGWRE